MKKIKRPNTIKMKRLLMHFIECNVNDRKTLRSPDDADRRSRSLATARSTRSAELDV